MTTPINDFVQEYAKKNPLRLHMPGHKGTSFLGIEHLDITEIQGSDSLYEADGIIAQSEANASKLFGCKTYYSTEGSSQCIRAMLYLTLLYAKQQGRKPLIAAVRNAHKTFLTAVALLDMQVDWLYSESNTSYLSCELTPMEIDRYLSNAKDKPVAVYVTSPDYLGKIADIQGLAKVCHRHDVLLIVDNAHGAYMRFLPESMHPIDLGADLCCDSAHKTLPVLTGGAYLHLSKEMDKAVGTQVKNSLMLFGSTSPSYLILQSLDVANRYLEDYPTRLKTQLPKIDEFKETLKQYGYCLYGDEPLKLIIDAKPFGYSGIQLADILRQEIIEPEYADPDYVVLMLSAEMTEEELNRLSKTLLHISPNPPIEEKSPRFIPCPKVLEIREAMLSDSETLPVEQCIGRILAVPTVGCPPAVPILVCGERIDEHSIKCFKYYGIDECQVVKIK